MKLLIYLCISVCLLPLTTFSNQHYNSYKTLEQALQNPSAITHLRLFSKHSLLDTFLLSIDNFPNVTHIHIGSADRDDSNNRLVLFLSKLPQLSHVSLRLSKLNQLPLNLNKIKGLKGIDIYLPEGLDNSYNRQNVRLMNLSPWIGVRPLEMNIFSARNDWSIDALSIIYEIYPQAVVEISSYRPLIPDTSILMKIPSEAVREKSWLKYDQYNFVTDVPVQLNGFDGFKVNIPADAFVDAYGNPVRDSVEVFASFIDSPLEMAFGGIPMTYDSGGTSYFLESDGMIDIRARANGKFLQLAPEKTLEIEIPSVTSGTNYNEYTFNDTTGKWQYEQVANSNSISSQSMLTDAYLVYRENRVGIWTSGRTSKVEPDLTLEHRFQSPDYIYTYQRDNSIFKGFDLEDEKQFKKLKSRYKRVTKDHKHKRFPKVRVVRIGNTPQGIRNVKWFKLETSNGKFPEFSHFKNVIWKTYNDLDDSYFKEIKKEPYCDVRLALDKSENNFQLFLKRLNGKIDTLIVIPYDMRTGQYDEIPADLFTHYHKTYQLKEYKKAMRVNKLGNKQRNKSKRTERKLIAQLRSDSESAWRKARKVMNTNELNMDMEQWEEYVRKLNLIEATAIARETEKQFAFRRLITMNGLGLYNCDRIMQGDGNKILAVNFVTSDQTFTPNSTYSIQYGVNSAFSLSGNQFVKRRNLPVNVISFDKEGYATFATWEQMVGIEPEGKVYTLETERRLADEALLLELNELISTF